jgi:hypothetical protein
MRHSLPLKGLPQLIGLGCGVRVKRSYASPRPPRNRVGTFRLGRDHLTLSSPVYGALNFENLNRIGFRENPKVLDRIPISGNTFGFGALTVVRCGSYLAAEQRSFSRVESFKPHVATPNRWGDMNFRNN